MNVLYVFPIIGLVLKDVNGNSVRFTAIAERRSLQQLYLKEWNEGMNNTTPKISS